MDRNVDVTDQEMAKIRGLADFDLVMLISEINDHGWTIARRTLGMMPGDPKRCPDCMGTGLDMDLYGHPCGRCGGRKTV